MNPPLEMFTVYHRPSDLPDAEYVVRRLLVFHNGVCPAELLGTAATLERARRLVPPSAGACLTRHATDEPQIVETWV